MAFSVITSAALHGIGAGLIRVEADVSNGLPVFHMVGYLSAEVKEAAERVRTAIRNSGIEFPPKKIVVNLSPAAVKKRGPGFDLPVALSVLAAMGKLPEGCLDGVMVAGELSLDGQIRRISGVLPMVMEAREAGCISCILPKENEAEGALVDGIRVIGVEDLRELCKYLNGEKKIAPAEHAFPGLPGEQTGDGMPDFSDIRGQEMLKRAVLVAVAGGHNLLLVGPPGSGKSMAASRIPTILPPLTPEESLEITRIYSVLGLVDGEHPLITQRPFRSVHHTVTKAALIGGGMIPRPGEISLAHGGVLYLDELAEFQRPVLEVLRQPLEERCVHLSRRNGNYEFPANCMLVAAMNPCPCGNYPDVEKCSCTPGQIQHYLGKISQPFLDRIDICAEAPRTEYEMLGKTGGTTSAQMREMVCRARRVQAERYRGTEIRWNSMLGVKELDLYCKLGREEKKLMEKAFHSLGLTARTYHKILKTARTIADLEGEEQVQASHLSEAVGYRMLNKKYWGR